MTTFSRDWRRHLDLWFKLCLDLLKRELTARQHSSSSRKEDLFKRPGLPDFLGTIYQNGGKYAKLQLNVPNVHKIYQHLPLQDPPKCTQIFGMKINHLATLLPTTR
jgi:hypothetical protein